MNAAAMLRAVPLLGFALIGANLLALLGEGFDTDLLILPLPSPAELVLHAGDLVVLGSLVLLFVEIFKATRTDAFAGFDHAASMLVLLVALAEFLFLERFGHAAFLALVLMSLLDVLSGYLLVGRRRHAGADRPGEY